MRRALVAASDNLTAFVLGGAVALAMVWGIDHDPDLAPTPPKQPVPCHGTAACDTTKAPEAVLPGENPGISDDTPGFNCLTMGDLTCGPEWDAMPDDTFEHIQGRPQTATDYCLWLIADTTLIACTDGLVATS